jgi:hypothetical protein
VIDMNFLTIIAKIYNDFKISQKFMKNIPSFTKDMNLDFYLNIRWQNGVPMEILIPRS